MGPNSLPKHEFLGDFKNNSTIIMFLIYTLKKITWKFYIILITTVVKCKKTNDQLLDKRGGGGGGKQHLLKLFILCPYVVGKYICSAQFWRSYPIVDVAAAARLGSHVDKLLLTISKVQRQC